MALTFGLWWIYFDFVARRQPRPGVWWSLSWGYLHLPLVMSIAAVGAAVQNVLAREGAAPGAAIRWLMAGALAVALATIGLIEVTLRRTPTEPTDPWVSCPLKIAAGVLALALGAWGGGLDSLGLLLGLILFVLIQMVYGAYVWFRPATS
jgi:low temperature requirement protein LtrA